MKCTLKKCCTWFDNSPYKYSGQETSENGIGRRDAARATENGKCNATKTIQRAPKKSRPTAYMGGRGRKIEHNSMKIQITTILAQPKHIPSQQQTLLQPQRML